MSKTDSVAPVTPPEFKFVVFNTSTGDALSKHKSQADANAEADNLRGYHNNDLFQVRSLDEAQKEFDDTGDVHKVTAVGDGTQPNRFIKDAVVNEAPKDKVQVKEDAAMAVAAKNDNPDERSFYDKDKPKKDDKK